MPPAALPQPSHPVTNAHDWVWLGRATLERSSVNTRCFQVLLPPEEIPKGVTIIHPPLPTVATTNGTTANVVATNVANPNVANPHVAVATSEELKKPQPRIRTNPMLTFTRPPPVPPHRTTKTTPVDSKAASPNCKAVSPNSKAPSPNSKVPSPNLKPPPFNGKASSPSSRALPPNPKVTSPPQPKVSPPNAKAALPGMRGPFARGVAPKGKENGRLPNTLEWEDVTKGMNYDQLVEYFDSLKESSA